MSQPQNLLTGWGPPQSIIDKYICLRNPNVNLTLTPVTRNLIQRSTNALVPTVDRRELTNNGGTKASRQIANIITR